MIVPGFIKKGLIYANQLSYTSEWQSISRFKHSLEIITPDPYEPKSIIKETLYHLSTLCEMSFWLNNKYILSGLC